jgi:hypothetical protein
MAFPPEQTHSNNNTTCQKKHTERVLLCAKAGRSRQDEIEFVTFRFPLDAKVTEPVTPGKSVIYGQKSYMTIDINHFCPPYLHSLNDISQLNQLDDVKKLNPRNPA